MHTEIEDTIAAIATPSGRSALGIVRVSGRQTADILQKVFAPKSGAMVPYRPTLGKLHLSGPTSIDEAVVTFYQAPHSYTREDLAELSCHGNPLILEAVLGGILSNGARLARPGEFTFRAFLNGRLDLVQATAVNDLITADSQYQAELALQQLDGHLSRRLAQIRERFLELISLLEGNIDFSEEQHYHFIGREESLSRHNQLHEMLQALLGTFERGRVIREGFRVALVGKPNVGKSSLFNSLLGKNRAIVTAKPGTTRDFLQESVTIGGHLIHLIDTAGVRETSEEVETEGIRRSLQVIESADLILFVIDGSEPLSAEDFRLWDETKRRETIVIMNKDDLPQRARFDAAIRPEIRVSAFTGSGLEEALEAVGRAVAKRVKYSTEDFIISNFRHRDILRRSIESLEKSRSAVADGLTEEFVLVPLHAALREVGQITGEVTVDDIYQHIFSHFCIGK